MKLIFVDSKTTIPSDKLNDLKVKLNIGDSDIVYLESKDSILDHLDSGVFQTDEEKIMGLAPEITDWEFKNEWFSKIKNLKGVCLATTAHTWIDGKFLRDNGTVLTNVPHYSTEAVAEHAIFLMLAVARKIPLIMDNNWELDYDKHAGTEVTQKTMGIIGLGNIGTRIAELGKAFGMNVIYWSPNSRDDRFDYVELDELFKRSDFLFPTFITTDETKQIVNDTRSKLMKPSAFLIDITSSKIYDYEIIKNMINSGNLAGYGVDFSKYKRKKNENILVTPDVGWYTKESLERNISIWIDSIVSVYKKSPINVVN